MIASAYPKAGQVLAERVHLASVRSPGLLGLLHLLHQIARLPGHRSAGVMHSPTARPQLASMESHWQRENLSRISSALLAPVQFIIVFLHAPEACLPLLRWGSKSRGLVTMTRKQLRMTPVSKVETLTVL